MTTKYFILTKSKNSILNDNSNNQIISLNDSQIFILPLENISYYISDGLFESNLMEWCKQFCSKDKIFLDIGAHSGTYTVALASLSKYVHAFEPQKMTYYSLCGSVALSNLYNVTCHNMGLGSEEQIGKNKLKIISNDGGGSTLHPSLTDKILSEEDIDINTLDSYNIENIGFIKMDVEKNEFKVLKGAIETLKKSNYPKILFEVNNINEEEKELFNFLKYYNYNVIQINEYKNMFLAVLK